MRYLLLLLGVAWAQPSMLERRKALLSHDLPLAAHEGRQKPDEIGVYDLQRVFIQLDFDGLQLPQNIRYEVRLLPQEALQVVPLLAAGFIPESVTQDGRPVQFDYAAESFEVLLFPDPPLRENQPVTFEIEAELTQECRQDTGCATDGTTLHLLDLGWYPLSYDSPLGDRFDIVIQSGAVPPLLVAASGARDGPDDQRRMTYSSVIPNIAAALAVGRYDLVEGDIVELFVPPQSVDGGAYLAEVATAALRFYDRLFGSYPFPRLGIAAIPDAAGAAIGPQANILIPTGLWRIPADLPDEAELVARVTAHEIGHQYFFNTLIILDEPEAWLSESWAEYAAVRHSRARTNTDDHRRENYWGYLLSVSGREAALFGETVRGHPNYFEIVYLKGSVVVDMLGRRIGPNRFDDLLADYIATFTDEIITTEEVEDFFAERAGRDVVNPFFRDWVYNPGYPTLTLSAQPARNDNAAVEVTARQDGTSFSGPLPLVLRREDGTNAPVTLDLRAGALRAEVSGVLGLWVDPDLTLLRRVQADPPADVNVNGVVDGMDLLDVWAHQGEQPPSERFRDPLDVNRDLAIDRGDVRAVIEQFGAGW